MARRRLRERITAGVQTILGQIAQFFRLGQAGAVQSPEEAQPGRERLRTPEEIVAILSQRHDLPAPDQGVRRSYSYVATWIDTSTGQRVGATRIQIEASPDVPRSTIDSRARREAALAIGTNSVPVYIRTLDYRMSLRRVGTIDLPPQP